MPRPTLPPTPVSSTEIQGLDGSQQLAALQSSFELPPPALLSGAENSTTTIAAAEAATVNVDMAMPSPPLAPAERAAKASSVAYVQAAETVKSRRRSAAARDNSFSLPPPPTRARKIIQMKPREATVTAATVSKMSAISGSKMASQHAAMATSLSGGSGKHPISNNAASQTAATAATKTTESATTPPATLMTLTPTPASGGKRKTPSATSAAGRKIARKTAHSLIERRRRSKMNEEFAMLKSMIPACTGEMHKLAILQASIEYVRYLQNCVATLQEQRKSEQPQHVLADGGDMAMPYGHTFSSQQHMSGPKDYTNDCQLPDVEMAGTVDVSGDDDGDGDDGDDIGDDVEDEEESNGVSGNIDSSPVSTLAHAPSVSVSPALLPQADYAAAGYARYGASQPRRHNSQSSTASDHRHYSYSGSGGGFSLSAQTSPALGPQLFFSAATVASSAVHHYATAHSVAGSNAGSTLTSPALLPQRDPDHEATAALLMLNSDRRGTRDTTGGNGSGSNGTSGRGMSVQELLST